MKLTVTYLLIITLLIPLGIKADVLSDSVNCHHSIALAWVKKAGSDTADAATGVCSDSDGNVYITGYFGHSINFESIELISQGQRDVFIAKYNIDGEFQWAISAGGSGDDYGNAIACDDEGNTYITGMFTEFALFGSIELYAYGQQDAFIASFDNQGNLRWAEAAGGWENDRGIDIVVDNQNNVFVTGIFDDALGIGSTTLLSNGDNDVFIGCFSSTGIFKWGKNIGSIGSDEATAIAVDASGRVFVSGVFTGNLISGSDLIPAQGINDGFVSCFGLQGDLLWSQVIGTPGNNDRVNAIAADGQGNVYASGYFDHDDQKTFVVKLDSDGNELWTVLTGGDSNARPLAAITDINDHVFIAGYFSGIAVFGNFLYTSAGNNDMFFLKITPGGIIKSVKTAGSSGNDQLLDIALDNNQNILIAGLYSNNMLLETETHASQGLTDLVLAKYDRLMSMGYLIFGANGCNDEDLCVEIDMLQGSPPYNYYWSTGDNETEVCGLSPATFWVTVVDQNQCYIDTSFVLEPPILPNIDMPANLSLCPFDTIVLDAGSGMLSYIWTNGATTQTITIWETGSYGVTVTNNFECEASAETVVTQLPNINLFESDTVYTCTGVPVVLSLQGVYASYLWSTGSTSSQTTAYGQGTYFVRVQQGQCHYYDTVRVKNYPVPELDLGGDRVLCRGDIINLQVSSEFSEYLWHDGSTENFYLVEFAGPVTLDIVDQNGCTAHDSIYVSEAEYPEVDLGDDLEFCDNMIPQIDAGNFATYAWSDGTILSWISPTESGTYSVTVSNTAGCSAADTISVVVYPAPSLELGDDIETCSNNEVALIGPNGFAQYLWSTGATAPIAHVHESGVYYLSVSDNYGCMAVDSITVVMFPTEIPYLGPDRVMCDSFPAILDPDGMFESYVWNDESNVSFYTAFNEGFYSVTVTDINGCTSSDGINISHAPSPSISEQFSEAGIIVVTAEGGIPPYIYSVDGRVWSPNGVFEHLLEDWYTVEVRDSNDCGDTIRVHVENNIIIPEFFTPNGDGYNDTWEIIGIFRYPEADILVFDRYGKKLAQYKGSDPGWDGYYARQQVVADTYWYVIVLNSETGYNIPFKGSVTIKR